MYDDKLHHARCDLLIRIQDQVSKDIHCIDVDHVFAGSELVLDRNIIALLHYVDRLYWMQCPEVNLQLPEMQTTFRPCTETEWFDLDSREWKPSVRPKVLQSSNERVAVFGETEDRGLRVTGSTHMFPLWGLSNGIPREGRALYFSAAEKRSGEAVREEAIPISAARAHDCDYAIVASASNHRLAPTLGGEPARFGEG